jgi:hypothetical protein
VGGAFAEAAHQTLEMKKLTLPITVGLAALTAATLATTQCERLTAGSSVTLHDGSLQSKVERGKHLVENIGLCADCHTARLPSGEFDKSKWLQGAPLGFKPLVEMPWNPVAPPIAGLPTMTTDEQAVEFLMNGKRPSGAPVLPPMPPYRFKRDEAEAVVAYLRSLKREA